MGSIDAALGEAPGEGGGHWTLRSLACLRISPRLRPSCTARRLLVLRCWRRRRPQSSPHPHDVSPHPRSPPPPPPPPAGPYFLSEFGLVDVTFAPFLERIVSSLLYYKGFAVRGQVQAGLVAGGRQAAGRQVPAAQGACRPPDTRRRLTCLPVLFLRSDRVAGPTWSAGLRPWKRAQRTQASRATTTRTCTTCRRSWAAACRVRSAGGPRCPRPRAVSVVGCAGT